MADIVLTGFAPFDGAESNPSWDVAQGVADAWSGPESLEIEQLPVSFGAAATHMHSLLAAHQPRLVVALGVAAGRTHLTPERVAINLIDARIADNDGFAPLDEEVVPDGPAAYFTTLPVKAMTAAMAAVGAPAQVSYSAGTYVCNALFYALQNATAGSSVHSGFIHVPATEEFARAADLPWTALDVQVTALRDALRTALDSPVDSSVSAGTEH
ncbi:pyroglutamyl-peptidase I [Demequina flava]|uniref:pyroglutamyl-peptidase I n=1 Tax=Demequina flava TaxID=1095025 RepID=UPI000783CB7C|nr:pyroglutamyl-peptidase I [Demequina flava]